MLNLLIFFIFLSKKVIKHYNKRNLFRYFVRNKNQKTNKQNCQRLPSSRPQK